ncbi:MAG: trigger factor [Dehalococcoidia bacterium]|nr:trigger factor [Dehalococcoidia bacterium]
MKTSTESTENRQVVMKVEIEAAEIEASLEHAYHHVVKEVAIPGFRKGKTPRAVLEQYVGKEAIRKEALEELVPELCMKIIEEQKLEVVAQPQVEMLQDEPAVFKATFSLRPNVELGDYRSIRIERPFVEVGDSEVDEFMQKLRERHGDWAPASRAAGFEDMVIIDVTQGEKGGEEKSHEGQQVLLVKDSVLPLPGFSEHVVGMAVGDEKEFTLSYAEDYRIKELAGKEFVFKVKLNEVKEKHLPELDDEFAKSLGEGMDTIDGLRKYAADGLKRAAEDRAKKEHESKVLEAVVNSATKIEYPPIMVEQEINSLMRDRDMALRERGGLRNYLKIIKKTEEELREELRPRAIEQVRHELVLGKVAEEENVTVDPAEIEADIENMMKGAGEGNEKLQDLFGTPQARQIVENRMIAQKTVQRLVDIAMGNAVNDPEQKAEAGKESKDGDAT